MVKVGDKVRLINGTEEGTVVAVNARQLLVDLDGIEIPLNVEDVVKIEHDHLIHKAAYQPKTKEEKDRNKKIARLVTEKEQAVKQAVYELDLHIEELLEHTRGWSNTEILQYQMNQCRSFIDEARKKKYLKVVLIHGVGEGVLRSEIHRWLDTLPYVAYSDAPYRTYGYGATEVRIRQN